MSSIPKDVLKMVCEYLNKEDLLLLESFCGDIFDKIPEVWWGKHYDYYAKQFEHYYNNNVNINGNRLVTSCKKSMLDERIVTFSDYEINLLTPPCLRTIDLLVITDIKTSKLPPPTSLLRLKKSRYFRII